MAATSPDWINHLTFVDLRYPNLRILATAQKQAEDTLSPHKSAGALDCWCSNGSHTRSVLAINLGVSTQPRFTKQEGYFGAGVTRHPPPGWKDAYSVMQTPVNSPNTRRTIFGMARWRPHHTKFTLIWHFTRNIHSFLTLKILPTGQSFRSLTMRRLLVHTNRTYTASIWQDTVSHDTPDDTETTPITTLPTYVSTTASNAATSGHMYVWTRTIHLHPYSTVQHEYTH